MAEHTHIDRGEIESLTDEELEERARTALNEEADAYVDADALNAALIEREGGTPDLTGIDEGELKKARGILEEVERENAADCCGDPACCPHDHEHKGAAPHAG